MAKKSAKPTSKSDERNIVGSDQVDIQDIENRILATWDENKGVILGGIAFVFAIFIGYQGFKLMQRQAEQSLMQSYQAAAGSNETLAAWAEEHDGKALSGFAFKRLGDDAYAAGDLAQAETYYRKAAASAESPVSDAAEIGLAVTLHDLGKTSDAKAILLPIADNPEALNQAEAQYRLAQLARAEGDTETARTLIEAIPDSAFFWKSRAEALATKLPEA